MVVGVASLQNSPTTEGHACHKDTLVPINIFYQACYMNIGTFFNCRLSCHKSQPKQPCVFSIIWNTIHVHVHICTILLHCTVNTCTSPILYMYLHELYYTCTISYSTLILDSSSHPIGYQWTSYNTEDPAQ